MISPGPVLRISTRAWIVPVVVALLEPLAPPGAPRRGAEAQVVELVQQRELEYQAALRRYEAAEAAWEAALNRANRASMEQNRARSSGDDDELNRAMARAAERWLEVEIQQRRVDETRDSLRVAGDALVAVLEERVEELFAEVEGATTRREQIELQALIRDRRNRIAEVEASISEEESSRSLARAVDITFDPRDGPVELLAKAELLERRVVAVDSVVRDIERRIEQLERRERQSQQLTNFMRSIERFDEGTVPMGEAGRRGGEDRPESQADSEEAGDASEPEDEPMTPAERIEALRAYRGQMEALREEVAIRARVFRERAERISTRSERSGGTAW